MGLFSYCCRGRRHRPPDDATSPLQLTNGSTDKSFEDEDDLQAVKSWRQQRTTTTTPQSLLPPQLPPLSDSTALVVFHSLQQLTTIDESMNDSRNTSVSSSQQQHQQLLLLPVNASFPLEDIESIPQQQQVPPTDDEHGSTSAPIPPPQQELVVDAPNPGNISKRSNPTAVNATTSIISPRKSRSLDDNGFDIRNQLHHDVPFSKMMMVGLDNVDHTNNDDNNTTSKDIFATSIQYDGGFPTFSREEEAWRKEQKDLLSQQQQHEQETPREEYLSSTSSNSTVEDPILLVRQLSDQHDKGVVGNGNRRSIGPIDLDDDDDDDDDLEMMMEDGETSHRRGDDEYNAMTEDYYDTTVLSSSFGSSTKRRPGPDDDNDLDRPMLQHSTKNNTSGGRSSISSSNGSSTERNTTMSKNSSDMNSGTNITDELHGMGSTTTATTNTRNILRDSEPERNSMNKSAESEELDAMIAAIDNTTGSSSFSNNNGSTRRSDQQLSRVPTLTTTNESLLTAIEWSNVQEHQGSGRQSPTTTTSLHLVTSQQHSTSPSLYSGGGSRGNSSGVPSIKLSPNRRDSPSVHDPTSYSTATVGDDNEDMMTDNRKNTNSPTVVSPSSDGSTSDGGPVPTTTTAATSSASHRRGRSSQQQHPIIDSSTRKIAIPETAQQRRKARSQSRGKRICDRARTLLSSYHDVNEDTNNNSRDDDVDPLPTELQSTAAATPALSSAPAVTIVDNPTSQQLHTKSIDATSTSTEEKDSQVRPFDVDSGRLNQPFATPRSLYDGITDTNNNNNSNNNTTTNDWTGTQITAYSRSLRSFDMDDQQSDRLSDIPSEVDPMLRERYLKACRILKSSLLEKDATIRPRDKEFLTQLLQETTPSKDDDDDDDDINDNQRCESTARTKPATFLLDRSTPLFDTATTVISTTDEFSTTASPTSYANTTPTSRTTSPDRHHHNNTLVTSPSGESSGVTEQELHVHNYVMNNQHVNNTNPTSTTKDLLFHTKNRQVTGTTSTVSQVSSSVFSRVDDDYPYTILGLTDVYRRSTVLLPWMMNALRGFLPLDMSHDNFWLKYQLDRNNTDTNHDDNRNLMSLLSKVQQNTYTVMCVETVDGSVFGTFCSSPWKMQEGWYGSGESSFVWRLKHPRRRNSRNGNDDTTAYTNENGMTNEIEIYPYTRYDSYVQYCTNQTLAVGGGTDWTLTKEGYSPYSHHPSINSNSDNDDDDDQLQPHTTGIGFLLDGDLMGGETNSCVTYANPRLSNNNHNDSSNNNNEPNEFDIQTLEVYTFTKHATIDEAELHSGATIDEAELHSGATSR